MNFNEAPITRLHELFRYDQDTGLFWRLAPQNRHRAGTIAGTRDGGGYIRLTIDGMFLPAHRAAWAMTYGTWPTGPIDHINRDRSDNRIANLRDATHSINQRNQKVRETSTSGIRGVRKRGDSWQAYLGTGGEHRVIGSFSTPEAAASARAEAEKLCGYLPEAEKAAERKKAQAKVKYCCPECEMKVWGKPKLRISCVDCGAMLDEEIK